MWTALGVRRPSPPLENDRPVPRTAAATVSNGPRMRVWPLREAESSTASSLHMAGFCSTACGQSHTKAPWPEWVAPADMVWGYDLRSFAAARCQVLAILDLVSRK